MNFIHFVWRAGSSLPTNSPRSGSLGSLSHLSLYRKSPPVLYGGSPGCLGVLLSCTRRASPRFCYYRHASDKKPNHRRVDFLGLEGLEEPTRLIRNDRGKLIRDLEFVLRCQLPHLYTNQTAQAAQSDR